MIEIMVVEAYILFLGACVGSFLNVCIVRLPKEQSVLRPPSHCVSCKKPIAWIDNIPLFSYLILGGKCRHCKARYSIRYFVIELITAISFFGLYKFFGLTLVTVAYWIMISGFIVATFVDFEHRIIPDEVSIGGMFVGIALSAFIPALHQSEFAHVGFGGFLAGLMVVICLALTLFPSLFTPTSEVQDQSDDRGIKILVAVSLLFISGVNFFAAYIPPALLPYALSLSAALSGYIVGGGAIYLMGLVGDVIFKKESMGGGDVKLMAMVGAFLGWKLALLAFFIAPFFGAVYGVIEKIRTKDSAIAYGPFLVLGSLLSLFYGNQIIQWIINGYRF
ncbi:MAG: prepilin peptidase [Candidatus Omnitrophica bacterium]|nr:prepilin peptidase [Candidatus Omnitrophota bacterium]